VISDRLLVIARCPDCAGTLSPDGNRTSRCGGCGRVYAQADGYLDLRPSTMFAEQTKYLDEALHADARHERVSPPLLGAGVRNYMLRQFLQLRPGELVADLGCGSGRMLVWNQPLGAHQVGIDVSPYFAEEALAGSDLVLGDLRTLPFASGVFVKAYSLDVFEHLSPAALAEVVKEMARVIEPGGHLFVYSHVRRNSRLALGLRAINRLAAALERVGLIDLRQERLRKSDHLNPLADVPDLERVVGAAGFRIVRIRYYTPLIGGFIENILMRMAERALGRGLRRRTSSRDASDRADEEARLARTAAKRHLDRGGPVLVVLKMLTYLMRLDVWLFGRIRSGPFFALLERTPGGEA